MVWGGDCGANLIDGFLIPGSFRPDFLSAFCSRGAVPLRKHVFMCVSSFQAAACCARFSILSANCDTFAVCMPKKMYRISVCFVLALTRFRS